MKNILTYTALCLFSLTIVQAQRHPEVQAPPGTDYRQLEEQVRRHKGDTAAAREAAQCWLRKARREKNAAQQANAYRAMMHLVDRKFRLIYADSLLEASRATKSNAVIGSGFLTIGAAHYDSKEYPQALDSYINASHFIAKTEDQYLVHKLHYSIALTKYFLGYHDEAISLLLQCIDYFRAENDLAYVKSLHAIGLCYTQIGRYDLSSYHNRLGLRLADEFELPGMAPYFKNSEGINLYRQKDYGAAIRLLHGSEPGLEKAKDHANQIATWSYLGKCHWEMEERDSAVSYFLKVHEGIQKRKYFRPDLRESYEMLIAYYAEHGELERQLHFIGILMAFDRNDDREFKHLSYKVHREYDTKSLLEKKKAIETELASDRKAHRAVVAAMGTALLGFIAWHLHGKRREKARFQKVLADFAQKEKAPPARTRNQPAGPGPELSRALIANLERFEVQKKYLERDMNLAKLAALLNTNTKYVSMLIAHHRGKKTTAYINDLKTDHIAALLIGNRKYRNYTNQALAEEAGFGSTQIFTLCFRNRIGMSPTSFIQRLRASEKEPPASQA